MQVSAAEKKKQLNSKGEKGRGLLDVFTQPEPKEEQVVNNSKVEVVRKSPTPEVQEPVAKEEPMKEVTKSLEKMEIAPKVVEEEKKEKSPTPVKEEEKKEEVKMEDKAVVEVKKAGEVVKPFKFFLLLLSSARTGVTAAYDKFYFEITYLSDPSPIITLPCLSISSTLD